FSRRMTPGEIMSRATNDLTQVRLLIGFGFLNMVNSVIAFGGSLGLMIAISPRLALYALTPYPVFVLLAKSFGKAIYTRSRTVQDTAGALSDRTHELLTANRLVRAFALNPYAEDRFEEANSKVTTATIRLATLRALMWPVLTSVSAIGTLITVGVGGR